LATARVTIDLMIDRSMIETSRVSSGTSMSNSLRSTVVPRRRSGETVLDRDFRRREDPVRQFA
jgi:hypothetical protein